MWTKRLVIILLLRSLSDEGSEVDATYLGGQNQTQDDDSTTEVGTMVPTNEAVIHHYGRHQRKAFLEGNIAWWIDLSTIPMFAVGLLGNQLTIIILNKSSLKDLSSSFFIKALAVSDSALILSAAVIRVTYLLQTSIGHINIYSDIFCRVIRYLIRATGDVSNWTLACMCAERSLAIAFPLKAKFLFTKRTNQVCFTIVLVAVMGFYVYLPVHVVREINGSCRSAGKPPGISLEALNKLGKSLTQLCPAVITALANVALVCYITRSWLERKQLQAQVSQQQQHHHSQKAKAYSLIRMLITISLSFFLLVTPFDLWVILDLPTPRSYRFANQQQAMYRLGLAIVMWLRYLHHTSTFYLYILVGKEMKGALLGMLKNLCSKMPHLGSSVTANTSAG